MEANELKGNEMNITTIDATGTWTKFNDCWMVKVTGEVTVRGEYLEIQVTKKDGAVQIVMTMNEPEFTKDGFAIYCPMKSLKSSNVAARNARANAKADGAVIRAGRAYYI